MFIGGDSGATRELIRQVNRAGGPETLMKIKGGDTIIGIFTDSSRCLYSNIPRVVM
ncbi:MULTISPECIES: hypothetical protein [Escherichia]|uniref:hypothetical protein n=1 Tax=Escherichia TaxID=561 RepID=UPI0013698E82|nr:MULTISPECIES: hypothetical protein [Escherichia]